VLASYLQIIGMRRPRDCDQHHHCKENVPPPSHNKPSHSPQLLKSTFKPFASHRVCFRNSSKKVSCFTNERDYAAAEHEISVIEPTLSLARHR
jgi:hypothetical protein